MFDPGVCLCMSVFENITNTYATEHRFSLFFCFAVIPYASMKKAGLSTFEQIGLDIVGETAGDGFGAAVSLSANGSALVVGAPSNNGNGCSYGNVRVYHWNSTNHNYVQVGSDIEGTSNRGIFGISVRMSTA